MDVSVRDNPAEHRFELIVDGAQAGLAAYRVRDGITVITHSEVDPAHQGQGLGGRLARLTLDHLRSTGARVVPACPFFAKYVSAHHDWDDILED
ncbi:GNAT family N-acetyltransferase [Actinoplanes sp. NPDC089786]|uniref:GNAT family N-acetyltransferase n=1 Tax=Actinoplanes sp. NPDC089786 TaxID=3155185 RepID=UPI0034312688